jgi:ABC-type transport system involved in multi-copper enzyme maturation permease subunit
MATFIITRLTFLEAVRRRIVLAGLVLGVAFLLLYGLGYYFMVTESGIPLDASGVGALLRGQIYNFLTNAGMYAVNFLSLAMGALIAADTLAGEISTGTVQALVTKPVRRWEIVLGKWLGFAGLLALYLTLMAGGVLAIVYLISGYIVPNALGGLSIIYLEVLLIMSLTLASSSRFSALATGGIVFGMYGLAFIGGWVEQVGAVIKNQTAVNIGILSSLLIPSEALFRRAAFEMTSPVLRSLGLSFGPMFVTSVPSPAMIVYAVLYLLAMVGLAVRQFSQRDL